MSSDEQHYLQLYQSGAGFFARFPNIRKIKRPSAISLVENVLPGSRHIKLLSSGLTNMRKKKGKNKVQQQHQGHANRSADVYRAPSERKEAGYIPHLSNDEIAVYQQNGKNHVAIRGTANKDDAKTDIVLASGNLKKTNRYKRNKKHLEKVKQQLGDIHSITGHSLAGALSQSLGDDKSFKNSEIVAFNPGAGITGMYGKRKSTVYTSSGDPVSALGMMTKKHDIHVVPSQGDSILDRHAMSNFTQSGGRIPVDMLNFL